MNRGKASSLLDGNGCLAIGRTEEIQSWSVWASIEETLMPEPIEDESEASVCFFARPRSFAVLAFLEWAFGLYGPARTRPYIYIHS